LVLDLASESEQNLEPQKRIGKLKAREGDISRIRRHAPNGAIVFSFGVREFADLITHTKFFVNRFRGFWDSETVWDIATSMRVNSAIDACILCENFVKFGPVTPELTGLI